MYHYLNLCFHLANYAKIFYKYEGVSPTGSHKPNTAIPQAYYNKLEGVKKLTTETGAGQWGSSLAFACNKFGIDLDVYMVKVSFDQKPYRRALFDMQAYIDYFDNKLFDSKYSESEVAMALSGLPSVG